MWKTPKNPKIEELTKSYRDRSFALSDLKPLFSEGKKICIWCLEPLKGAQRKWCSKECSDAAFTWANPQSEYGLNVLLARQNWKCNICQYDYGPLVLQLLSNGRVYNKPENHNTQLCPSLALRIKQYSPDGTKPEVDHIVPISKGGQSIGLDQHQAICYNCHKAKTKVDNSGPRKKKEES